MSVGILSATKHTIEVAELLSVKWSDRKATLGVGHVHTNTASTSLVLTSMHCIFGVLTENIKKKPKWYIQVPNATQKCHSHTSQTSPLPPYHPSDLPPFMCPCKLSHCSYPASPHSHKQKTLFRWRIILTAPLFRPTLFQAHTVDIPSQSGKDFFGKHRRTIPCDPFPTGRAHRHRWCDRDTQSIRLPGQ